MCFWWFMLLCDLLIPAVMMLAGYMMRMHCPKQINRVVGYRTARSMKNMDTWKFAHDYCGRLWQRIGAFLLPLSVLIHIPFYRSDVKTIGCVGSVFVTIQLLVLAASLIPTERALKRTFRDDGTRR